MTTIMYKRRANTGHGSGLFGRGGAARGALAFLAVALLGAVPAGARPPQQQVTVRFLDPTSGKPIRKYPVGIIQWKANASDAGLAEDVASSQSLRTDGNGEIVVKLADPLPGSISIACFDLVKEATGSIDIRDVLKSGVVLRVDVKTWRWIRELTGKPGEIVIFNRKRTLWERMRRELP